MGSSVGIVLILMGVEFSSKDVTEDGYVFNSHYNNKLLIK
jgi:hypothetical protein